MDRRHFLENAAFAAAAVTLPAGCRRAHKGEIVMALGWVPDVEYADLWVALERGYMRDEGLRFRYLPGGPNAPSPVLEVAAGEATFGDADWLPFLDAVAQGNDFVIIASLFPVLPGGVISLPGHPIRKPADLAGQRFLVQGPTERAMLDALFRINGLPIDYKAVPVGFSPEPLLHGAGDAYFCYITNQPNTLRKMGMVEGKDFFVTRLYDLGYRVPTSLVTVERATLRRNRPELVKFLRALLLGHFGNAADPEMGARLAVETYGADLGLDLEQQTQLNRIQIALETGPGAAMPFWISIEDLRGDMSSVARASGRAAPKDPARMMDMSLLEEAFRSLPAEVTVRGRSV